MNRQTRREFLKTTGVAVGGCLFSSIVPAQGAASRKPNILVIMSDEHNASVLGCYGNNIINSPNLDSLAHNGITFDSCYCNSPLCVPSRLSFTSGKYEIGRAHV